jgi:4-amino-4-deoxy-L-arabinose transferase-like glycosyltransferase
MRPLLGSRPNSWSTFGDPALVIALAATVLLTNLGGPPLFDDDEPRNAGCSLAMLDSGDWVVPTFNGELRVHKPPLVNWLQMAGFGLAGRNETGARLASAIATILSCLLVWRIGCVSFGADHGRWAGIVMAACVWTSVGGRAATPDAPLVVATTASLWLLCRSLTPSGRLLLSRGQAGALGLALGVAVLAKGPVGLVLPMLAVILFVTWQACGRDACGLPLPWHCRLASAVAETRPLTTLGMAAAVCLPWYVWVGLRTDWEWPQRFLLEHNLDRFTGSLEGHAGSPAYYPVVLLAGLFPWSIASIVSLVHVVGSLRSGPLTHGHAVRRLLVAWIVAWVGFFSLAGTKLPGYVWPAYPALAVLLADFWLTWAREAAAGVVRRGIARLMPLAWLSLIVVGIAICIGGPPAIRDAVPVASTAAWPWLVATGLLVAAGGCVAWLQQVAVLPAGSRGIPMTLAIVGVGMTTLLHAGLTDRVASSLGPRPLVATIPDDAEVAVGSWGSPSGVFYATARGNALHVPRLEEPEDMLSHVARHPRAFMLVDPRFAERVLDRLPETHHILAAAKTLPGGQQLILIGPAGEPSPWTDLATAAERAAPCPVFH